MSTGEIAAATIFGIWFALSVVVQFPPSWCKLPRKFEPTGHLLPGWHFFSPKPIIADIELLFRWSPSEDPEGPRSDWVEVMPYGDRPLRHMLVNPRRRARKAIFHCCHQLLLAAATSPERKVELCLSVPYLLVLDHVTALCPNAATVQFRIDVIRHGAFPVVTAFVSPTHAVSAPVDSSDMEIVKAS